MRRDVLPKVHLLFYEYFFRAAVSKEEWNATVLSYSKRSSTRYSTEMMEAYVMAILEDKYFAWLYEYYTDLAIRKRKKDNTVKDPASFLKLDYHVFHEDTNNGKVRACDLIFDGTEWEIETTKRKLLIIPKEHERYETLKEDRLKMQNKLAADAMRRREVPATVPAGKRNIW